MHLQEVARCQREGCTGTGSYSPRITFRTHKAGFPDHPVPMFFDLVVCFEHATPENAESFINNSIKSLIYGMAEGMQSDTLKDEDIKAEWVPMQEMLSFFVEQRKQGAKPQEIVVPNNVL